MALIKPGILAALLIAGCASQPSLNDITNPPTQVDADRQFADVFKMLDGTWEGTFNIYVDTRGQQTVPVMPQTFDPDVWQHPPYKLSGTLSVTQVYESSSPYFQTVQITDRYPDGRVVESRGVNKIQDGKMWCVVQKPDDTVIHDGVLESPDTILWSRERTSPKSFEFFRETVSGDTYRIVGWGYYGDDDVTKAPRMYFDATYVRAR